MNNYISTTLSNILATFQSISAFFYQRIDQSVYTNNSLATYVVNYSLLLPSSKFILILNENQVNAQIQAYINLCNVLNQYLTSDLTVQLNLQFERIQNQLNSSIAQLNGFSISLLKAQYQNLLKYTVPYNMSLSQAIYLNNIPLTSYPQQVTLNGGVADFNNLQQNTIITLSI